jgi:hypothetical protein
MRDVDISNVLRCDGWRGNFYLTGERTAISRSDKYCPRKAPRSTRNGRGETHVESRPYANGGGGGGPTPGNLIQELLQVHV